ncbi:patatin-like phospholipase [Legionella lansingensis]|uniref:Patatin-like phospholipase n=1 Tax=Legionella lansingensis TaxID=45067 RepID=A0A0W0VZC4_9GAMM|nr:patatin-like phospholipase family protein [Legionella lansingensis]KTD25386.1 patatin-like phospholipase [Legionella lansingensis]SNV51324.1 patatin-like phospholipase [Legionella lansingensis]
MAARFSCDTEKYNNVVNKRIVLVLQGGGALGAFQAGVYETLEKFKYTPNWIGGTSIGAINASIIAGNEPKNRLPKLKEFWKKVAQPEWPHANFEFSDPIRKFLTDLQIQQIILSGIPVFFIPRSDAIMSMLYGYFNSYYDTSPLSYLLQELVDFEYLNNHSEIRLSLGATNINTGQMRYFDSKFEEIGPEHVMASGALPPAFPPIKIEGEYYWDGGVYSNTPLSIVLDDDPRVSSLCFMVDLWSPAGQLPMSMDEVKRRTEEIIYSSRANEHRKNYEVKHNLRRAIRALYAQLSEEKKQDPQNIELVSLGCITSMDIVQLQYKQKNWESSTKGTDFSAYSIRERWEQGANHTLRMIKHKKLCKPHPPHVGVIIHRDIE